MYRDKEPTYKVWTDASKFCYRRGCNCRGCYMREIIESPCLMKRTVMRLVEKLGAPPEDEERLKPQEQKIVDAILNGADTFEEISEATDITVCSVKSALTKMYPMAEYDGVIYTNKRWKFPQFVKWIRGMECETY